MPSEKQIPENKVKYSGVPTIEEVRYFGSYPSEERLRNGLTAVIECMEEIPCNPCITACPHRAITMPGDNLCAAPKLDEGACVGCGLCVSKCPGQAIFMIGYTEEPGMAVVGFPYEYLPRPKVGDTVAATDREGRVVTLGTVWRLQDSPANNGTAVIYLTIPDKFIHAVRGMKREPLLMEDYDLMVCRCEEVTKGQIIEAIKRGASDINEIKRMTRAGMGLCGGKTCGDHVKKIAREMGIADAIESHLHVRTPARPLKIKHLKTELG